ncbi:MAG TPA: TerC family protein [Balneolales bacterium]|nr:TerC family protein [Balneolales bacterium]
MSHDIWLWVGFNIFVLLMLAVDLLVFNKKPHEVSIKESLIWTFVWIALSVVFGFGIYHFMGKEAGLHYFTGYLIEKSLSMDNIFVFLLIFKYFRIPKRYQHEVLYWGILGALIMRFLFIITGVALINKFHWVVYIFGSFLLYTGIKMAMEKDKEVHPEKNPVIRLLRRFLPVTHHLQKDNFIIKKRGIYIATPLLVVLIVIETTDVIFAMDSIPAILAITRDIFIVYSSNVFAILGLRALYFSLAGIMDLFHYLHYGLAGILIFVGLKMLVENFVHVPVEWSLLIIGALLTISIVVSLIFPQKSEKEKMESAG